MSETRIAELTEAEVRAVQEDARAKLGICKKQNDIIGQQIFSILSLHARVIYYPLGADSVWGFTRIKGSVESEAEQNPFVAINSSIPLDCQVFAAAHELYHIWYDNHVDVIPANIMDDPIDDRNELKANRFAAEFLVEEDLLRKEMRIHGIPSGKIVLKDILKLADLFCVPYRTMVKRLCEIGTISKAERSGFLEITEAELSAARRRYAFSIPGADNRIAIDNLTDLAVNAYEKQQITYEKLEYLLDLSNLKPADVGIDEPARSAFPSDDELDGIMEE